MRRAYASAFLFSLAASCGATPPTQPASLPRHHVRGSSRASSAPAPTEPAAPIAVDAGAARDAPAAPGAPERARSDAAGRPELAADEAAWLPARVLRAIVDATGALPAPTRPLRREAVVSWSLVADASTDASRFDAACAAVTRAEPRVACATDTVEWAGADRARVVVAWRSPEATTAVTYVQPLRALTHAGEGLCVAYAERTLRTLDVTVRAASHEALGRALALVTVSPGLADLIVARTEARGDGVEAVLSWPLDRAQGAPDMGADAWPARCDGRSTVGADALPRTVPVALERVLGRASQAALVRVGRREWLVTAGDRAASADVVGVRDAGVAVRVAWRPGTFVLRYAGR